MQFFVLNGLPAQTVLAMETLFRETPHALRSMFWRGYLHLDLAFQVNVVAPALLMFAMYFVFRSRPPEKRNKLESDCN